MTQDPHTPEPENLPAAHRGPAPSHALQLRGNHALGMPTTQAPSLQEEDDDTLDLRDLWRMVDVGVPEFVYYLYDPMY